MNSSILGAAITGITRKWAKQRKNEKRQASRVAKRKAVWHRDARTTAKDAVAMYIEDAYAKASARGTLTVTARQIMYAVRPRVQELTGEPLNDQYFSQTLLPDFINEHPALTSKWDVTFDARGHLHEPHTDAEVAIGTLEVRDYITAAMDTARPAFDDVRQLSPDFPTHGPRHRYGAILFVEKEGFMPLFRSVRLAERFDVAIMSTKGMSVTASRLLVDKLCHTHDIPLFILRDFDKSGFGIAASFRNDTRRYSYAHDIKVVDLGLRLEDVKQWGLDSEEVHYGKTDPTDNLRDNGATDEEIAFLRNADWTHQRGYSGRRVELNAFTSDKFIEWIEGKLVANGVVKVVPDAEVLAEAYRRAVATTIINRGIEKLAEQAKQYIDAMALPVGLAAKVAERLKQDPGQPWDAAISAMADSQSKGEPNA